MAMQSELTVADELRYDALPDGVRTLCDKKIDHALTTRSDGAWSRGYNTGFTDGKAAGYDSGYAAGRKAAERTATGGSNKA